MTAPPENDAAPSGNGAGVSGSNTSTDYTLARLPHSPPARHNAPARTSEATAGRIVSHVTQQREAVLGAVRRAGAFGATDAEIEAASGFRAQSVSPRRGELQTLGLIADSGRPRLTPRWRTAAAVCIATQRAPALGGGPDHG